MGFGGPTPRFPLGNIREMKVDTKIINNDASSSLAISHNIHPIVFPYFARWQKSHGKVFVYWMGKEPFFYIAEPEFLKKMSSKVHGNKWGKPNVFKHDRKPMFGSGLVMVERDDWAMASLILEPATKMLERWTILINSGKPEMDVEREISSMIGEIIARATFGYVGVPFSHWICPKKNLEAKKLGKEIGQLLWSIIKDWDGSHHRYLVGYLMEGERLSAREIVD
ncbi:hypothetical protein Gogos_020558 [Gossypium gossypioides]|uniref:Uncharacterized protein n=1 Tax=Gossypium gossypioides TaxID=34282 RepID=A0A7J9CZW7_GOSGO|nr:hypothetical protein [Gossypium gossypioides]